jgi:hypothetical protein
VEGLLLFRPRLRLLQDALERPAEFDKSDVQAREQPDDRIEPGGVQPAPQAGQIPPVDAQTPAPAAPARVRPSGAVSERFGHRPAGFELFAL